ncbi:MAG TPA: hypothetical protein VLH56_11755 [Dissulfurispiraceae bacterium]|nr:hypothetical protein [Dissulfurispiraceae bacterium]
MMDFERTGRWHQSTTIWAATIALVFSAMTVFGIGIDDRGDIYNTLYAVVTGFASFFAILGRLGASTRITVFSERKK